MCLWNTNNMRQNFLGREGVDILKYQKQSWNGKALSTTGILVDIFFCIMTTDHGKWILGKK
jgi:hypothetical protein